MKKSFTMLIAVILALSLSCGALAQEGEVFPNLEKAAGYAYLDLDTADADLREKILDARNEIINGTNWVEDDAEAYIVDTETGEVLQELPHFSEVFPSDWEQPSCKLAYMN